MINSSRRTTPHPKGNGRSNRNKRVGMNPTSGQTLLPPVYHAILETNWTGYISSAALGNTGNFFDLMVNSITTPFGSGTYTPILSSGSPDFFGNSSAGAATTANPIGSAFAAANYGSYKVTEYEIIITCTPQASGDTIAQAMFPMGDQETPTTGAWTYFRGCAQPNARSGLAINGANSRLNTLRFRGKIHQDLGMSKQQWLDLPNTIMGSTPTGNQSDYFGYVCSTIDGGSNASPVTFTAKLKQRVRFCDRLQLGN